MEVIWGQERSWTVIEVIAPDCSVPVADRAARQLEVIVVMDGHCVIAPNARRRSLTAPPGNWKSLRSWTVIVSLPLMLGAGR